MTTTSTANELTITRLIPAGIGQTFDAWVVPEMRMKWWAAKEGMTCDTCEIDARVGGRYRINMKTPDEAHQYIVVGAFTEFDRPNRLAMTWSWEPGSEDPSEPGSFARDTRVEIDFESVEGGTLVRVHHSGFADAEHCSNHVEGWTGCLGHLEGLF